MDQILVLPDLLDELDDPALIVEALAALGVIALVSKNSLTSSGQKWEIQCAKEEGKPLLGVWAYTADRTNVVGVRTVPWTDSNIAGFIDSL